MMRPARFELATSRSGGDEGNGRDHPPVLWFRPLGHSERAPIASSVSGQFRRVTANRWPQLAAHRCRR